jgi:hypothetical protein
MDKKILPSLLIMIKPLLIGGILLVQAACPSLKSSSSKPKEVRRSAYYWKSSFNITNEDKAKLKSAGINTLYVKLFEVGNDYEEVPIETPEASSNSKEEVDKPKPSYPLPSAGHNIWGKPDIPEFEVIPVIFIHPGILPKLSTPQIRELAQKIMKKAGCLPYLNTAKLGPNRPFKELQIDCDWQKSQQKTYFELLSAMQALNKDIEFSVTLRLYAYKYFKEMGVPPVSRCMLMPYNLHAPDISKGPSIYNENEAEPYFGNTEYPLPLDMALPTFGWVKTFQDNTFKRLYVLTNDTIDAELLDLTNPIVNGLKIKKESDYKQYKGIRDYCYFEQGDELYWDSPKKSDLLHISEISRKAMKGKFSVCLFSIDDYLFNQYTKEALDEVFSAFLP